MRGADDDEARRATALFEEAYGRLPQGGSAGALATLVERFAHLPYENLSKILAWDGGQRPPTLRLPARVVAEHLALGTGGTCFSLTELLRVLAGASGLEAHPVLAHMRHGPNIHCALRVVAGGRPYLVDPGYLVRRPLALDEARADAPDPRELGAPLLVPAGALAGAPPGLPAGDFDLYTLEPDGPRFRYRFSDRAPTAEEFRACWLASFAQLGMRSLLATQRTAAGELVYLHNHKLRRRRDAQRHTCNVRAELEAQVQLAFGIAPEVTRRAAAIVAALRAAHRAAARAPADAPPTSSAAATEER